MITSITPMTTGINNTTIIKVRRERKARTKKTRTRKRKIRRRQNKKERRKSRRKRTQRRKPIDRRMLKERQLTKGERRTKRDGSKMLKGSVRKRGEVYSQRKKKKIHCKMKKNLM